MRILAADCGLEPVYKALFKLASEVLDLRGARIA